MIAGLLEFGAGALLLTFRPAPLLLALVLALVIRSKVHAVLVVANLWLLMELATTLLQPGYGFGSLVYERLVASALQVAIGYGAVTLWRRWRVGAERVTVH